MVLHLSAMRASKDAHIVGCRQKGEMERAEQALELMRSKSIPVPITVINMMIRGHGNRFAHAPIPRAGKIAALTPRLSYPRFDTQKQWE